MAEHTPGPWYVSKGGQYVRHLEPGPGGGEWVGVNICEVTDHDEREANARLLAAAPELMEALECVLADWFRAGTISVEHSHAARTAIAKAKGEQS